MYFPLFKRASFSFLNRLSGPPRARRGAQPLRPSGTAVAPGGVARAPSLVCVWRAGCPRRTLQRLRIPAPPQGPGACSVAVFGNLLGPNLSKSLSLRLPSDRRSQPPRPRGCGPPRASVQDRAAPSPCCTAPARGPPPPGPLPAALLTSLGLSPCSVWPAAAARGAGCRERGGVFRK